jgi:phage gp45-like
MKNLYLIVFSLFILQSIQSQKELSINLDYMDRYFDELIQVEPYKEDFFVITETNGYKRTKTGRMSCGMIGRIDKFGNKLWNKFIVPDNDNDVYKYQGRRMILNKDTIIIISSIANDSTVKQVLISKYLTDGTAILSKKLTVPGNFYDIAAGIYLLDNNYYVWTSATTTNYQILRYDLNFNKIDSITINTYGVSNLGQFMTKTNDGKLLFSYSSFDSKFGQSYHLLLLDKNLKTLKNYTGFQNSITQDATVFTYPTIDNGFIVAWFKDAHLTLADTFAFPPIVFKLDSNFHKEWEYIFYHISFKELISFRDIGNGQYLGSGASDYYETVSHNPNPIGGDYNGWVFVIDDKGKLHWERHIYDTRYTGGGGFFDGVKTKTGYSFVGLLDTVKKVGDPFLNDPDGWFLTLDANGCWNGNCDTYILINTDTSSTVSTSNIESGRTKVYPNPTSEIITIENENTENSIVQIFNIEGNKLMEHPLDAKRSIINISNLQSGTYILNILNKKLKILDTKKIIIQH